MVGVPPFHLQGGGRHAQVSLAEATVRVHPRPKTPIAIDRSSRLWCFLCVIRCKWNDALEAGPATNTHHSSPPASPSELGPLGLYNGAIIALTTLGHAVRTGLLTSARRATHAQLPSSPAPGCCCTDTRAAEPAEGAERKTIRQHVVGTHCGVRGINSYGKPVSRFGGMEKQGEVDGWRHGWGYLFDTFFSRALP